LRKTIARFIIPAGIITIGGIINRCIIIRPIVDRKKIFEKPPDASGGLLF
jgi:hypothetical protein